MAPHLRFSWVGDAVALLLLELLHVTAGCVQQYQHAAVGDRGPDALRVDSSCYIIW